MRFPALEAAGAVPQRRGKNRHCPARGQRLAVQKPKSYGV